MPIIYIEAGQKECASWQFKEGQDALALFLSGDAATSFKDSASVGAVSVIILGAVAQAISLNKPLSTQPGARSSI